MYIIDKLQKLYEIEGISQIDGELAYYLLTHLKEMKSMTLQKCIQDTGISKASIHRFYSKAKFPSFKDLTKEIYREYHLLENKNFEMLPTNLPFENTLDVSHIQSLAKHMINASKILFYGNQEEMNILSNTFDALRKHNKMFKSLMNWNYSIMMDEIESLKENDLLVIIDTSMKIHMFNEATLNQADMIKLSHLKDFPFHKYYIGDGMNNDYGFETIQLLLTHKQMKNIDLALFDIQLSYDIDQGGML